jgi:pyrroline-5-carboxylate reductase
MVQLTKEHPAILKDRVATPGGTTIAGLQVLEADGLRGILMKAIAASTQRARQIKR